MGKHSRKSTRDRDEQGTDYWRDWEAERRSRAAQEFGRRGGYGRLEPEDDFYQDRGIDRTEHAARDTGAPREGRRRRFDRQTYGDPSYAGYGEESYEETPYMRERSRQPRGSRKQSGGRSRQSAERFGRYQSGYQGAYEDESAAVGYGAEGAPEEDTYYEDLDEGSVYGHGPSYEGAGQSDYGLDAGYTTGASPGGIWRGEYSGRAPRGYTRSDERIREDICDRLSAHGGIDPSEVDVTVENGEVTLEGYVPSRAMKRQTENVADAVVGVNDVHNRLRVGRKQQERASEEAGDREPR